LSNPGHTATLLKALRIEKATPNKTPMASGVKLTRTGGGLLPEGNRYAKLIRSLFYLSTTTRPDIAFSMGMLSLFMCCPEEDHMRAAKGVFRFLRGTTRLGEVYGGSEPLEGSFHGFWPILARSCRPTAPLGRVDFGEVYFFAVFGPHLDVLSFGQCRPVGPASIWCELYLADCGWV